MSLLARSSRRHLLRHPLQMGLTALGVAIAVAVVVGIDLANATATRAFLLSVEGVAGRATHEITAGPAGVDEALYTALRRAGWRQTAPVVEGFLTTPLAPRRPLRLFGVDPFAEDLFRGFTRTLEGGAGQGDLGHFLTTPGAVLATPELAAELGVVTGDEIPIRFAGRDRKLLLLGLLEPDDDLERRLSRDLLVADIATAQEILGEVGHLSRIDVLLDGDAEADAPAVARLAAELPDGVELVAKSARGGALDQMTRAFRLNLQALSLLALIVGVFLIYNAMTFSVVKRRTLIGTLRAMGVTRREIFAGILAEATLVAIVGSLVGVGLGIVLARGLVGLVVQTINDLYFVLTVRDVALPALALIKGVGLGVGGTILATIVPAREATEAPPRAVLERSYLERRARRALPRLSLAGAGLLVGAALILILPSRSLVLAFTGVFLVLMGSALLVPGATFVSVRLLRPVLARLFGILGSFAARGVAGTLSRTGVAMAALVIAVAMTIGVTVMVRSFRATLVNWLEVTLQADVYLSPADIDARGEGRDLDPEVIARTGELPGVSYLTTYRRTRVQPVGDATSEPARLLVLGIEEPAFASFRFAEGHFSGGDQDEIWRRFLGGAVIVSEPFAFHRGAGAGDRLELQTDRGPRGFDIAGVFYDYASDRGVVTLHRTTYDRFWDDPSVQSLGLYAASGIDAEMLASEVRRVASGRQDLQVAVNRELRASALEIFDRTFKITAVLRLLAVAVAFIGILSALMALQLERARELAVLRANGLVPSQVWGLVTTQTGLMGLVAGLLAAPLGVVLAALLIHVINRRSFGWTLEMSLTPGVLLQSILLALAAALLAGIYPAWKMSKASPAGALREE